MVPARRAHSRLKQLAEVTGGRSFLAASPAELGSVYQAIEQDLRAQYRISYQSSNTSTESTFRAVQVKVAKGGLDTRTISGYYP